jgi:hypothetical protein
MTGPLPQVMGEVFSDALPAEDAVLYGHADLEPKGAFEARSFQTFKLTYTTGRYGLDDTGSVRIVFRFTADGGALQMDDPAALNYVTAKSSNGVPLQLAFNASGHQRPWYQALTVTVTRGYLSEGDSIVVTVGDTSGGSPGFRIQSMCETAFVWRVLADVCATGHYLPIADSPIMSVVPGPPANWKAVLPTLRRPGETFRLGIKAEDRYGNPSDRVETTVHLKPSRPIKGLPESAPFEKGMRALTIDGLSLDDEGEVAIEVQDEAGATLAMTNPLHVRAGGPASYWADMHGQSGESVGINTAREYFTFARDLAFLDATSHQANDFQINGAFWALINELTAEFHEDGRFLTLPGYEWSGNTGVGGDRNVYFRTEGRTIHRSSHALIKDRQEIHTDAPTARALFAALQDEDCVVYAHIGGRPANVAYAHDPRLETAMEIHSAWGTFEWLMADCFANGYRVGVVANSDGHKGRPGASYPGASEFGAYGGLTCFLMERLDRDALFDCLRQRRHYATTGDRIHIELDVTAPGGFERFDIDPLVAETPGAHFTSLQMGDIAKAHDAEASLAFRVEARAPIERVDVLNGMTTVATVRNPAPLELPGRVRVLWRGAMVKGRGAKARWQGRATFRDAALLDTHEINAWNPDRVLTREGDDALTWESVTAGNFGAFDVWLDEGDDAAVEIATNHVEARVPLAEVGVEDYVIPAGGLDLEVRLHRLPARLESGPLEAEVEVQLASGRDNPLWIRVTTEDGFQAWTSPVYLFDA